MEDYVKKDNIKYGLLLAACVAIPLGISFIASFITSSKIPGWYESLTKPSFNPPNWVFGPVWTILYIMMGIALYLVWKRGLHRKKVRRAVNVFAVQMLLNFLWTPAFFGMQSLGAGLVVIVLLLGAIVATIIIFWSVSRIASVLLLPYFFWVSFATVLNLSLYLMNR
jgi:tryptophan-rich sensory protein